jgi:hypothetical protein
MAEYSVEMTKIPRLQVGKSDVIFQIKQDDENLGSLKISKGHIVWTPDKKQYSYWLNWNDFNEIVVEKGQPRKVSF